MTYDDDEPRGDTRGEPREAADRQPRRARRRFGFTLIELLVAIAILGILGTVVIREIWNYMDDAKQETAQAKVKSIADIVQMYRRKHNEVPNDLHVLTQQDEMNNGQPWLEDTDLLDPWNHEYIIKLSSDKGGQFEVLSLGANGMEDGFTSDFKLDRDIGSNHSIHADAAGTSTRR